MSDAKTKWTTARVGANFVSHPSDARPGDFLIMELTQTSHRIESVTYRLNGQTLLEAAGLEPHEYQPGAEIVIAGTIFHPLGKLARIRDPYNESRTAWALLVEDVTPAPD